MNKIVAITGGFGHLGSVVGQAFATAGWQVALLDRAVSPRYPQAGALCLGGVDLTDSAAAHHAIDRAAEHFGGLDALINVAGGFHWETLADGDVDTWDLMYRINLRTAVVSSQAVLEHLKARGRGRILNIAAAAATRAALGMGAYAASKAGVMRLTEALAEELKDARITVNALMPSIIDTPQNRADMPGAEFDRWVRPEQLAATLLFLASDQAAAITGACIPVTGRV
ncbi:SDR family NAD(P)-dependent oxidoreductase [Pseudomonas sp. ZM23]|uniref:SDR family NAD(P)-dependent oxidoreductase n=1 Tax=Pseudomonas triclosanedens TaxID=2961893 RepID=A0ABY6ZYN2_9PSED|nr:SDR family NAD(P)-dependent oxidoreductase [Pseudomonas triclosanedens]MCP8462758.1 SDR family NAD(P)-dependent oxidoreductase [Pseudomonas triclosanedens]MCP8468378.1 SDR family NAD(P)-dependent oxidoreductase [Pseudomonas triclosanedens]MCP8475137.1 SDR family NAD(P)-dependent oxidoreductase [Pseudomonas triclosanedens]WAI49943.1 SDR family NAD(P)-dependent oxidoreductase [Pseudomonas triclosanedens]